MSKLVANFIFASIHLRRQRCCLSPAQVGSCSQIWQSPVNAPHACSGCEKVVKTAITDFIEYEIPMFEVAFVRMVKALVSNWGFTTL